MANPQLILLSKHYTMDIGNPEELSYFYGSVNLPSELMV